jgi:threonine dehydratase
LITIRDIEQARDRIGPVVLQTPLLVDPSGSGLRIKAEHLQLTGSFKARGAANRMTVAAAEGIKQVVTASSGNHGQAVAYMAQRLGIKATVVVPEDAIKRKVEGIRSWGAEVEFCGRTSPERLSRAEQISQQTGAAFIPPYNDPYVMAGQGTIGLEILDQAPDVKTVYVPIGGGGLMSGVATAVKERNPNVRVIGVEPESANDTYLSLQLGQILSIPRSGTIADGLRSNQPGTLTFPVMQRYVDEVLLVSEAEILRAWRYLLVQMRQLVEPSGAVGVAAAMRSGGEGVAVISGGNIELSAIDKLMIDSAGINS